VLLVILKVPSFPQVTQSIQEVFLKAGDKDFPYLAAGLLLYLDTMSFWTAPKSDHQMANSEELMVGL
jgi:hypothetical protein